MLKCSEVLQCNDGTSNKVSNIIRRHIDNRKLLLICILPLSHLIFFRFLFYQYMVVFLFDTVIYVFLLLESMYSYCCLCILIVRQCILKVVYVFLLLSMYSYFSSMYSYCLSMYSYCCLRILRRGYPD